MLSVFQTEAAIIAADTYFTLRSTVNAGPATEIDATFGGGFQGFVTNVEGGQVDHTHWEFDMSLIGGPVQNATLDWSWFSSQATDTVFVETYSADGIASLADWVVTSGTPYASFNATTTTLDITNLINASLGLSHLGIVFSIDSHPNQAFLGQSVDPMSLSFASAVPEPSIIAIFGLGLLGLGFARRRMHN